MLPPELRTRVLDAIRSEPSPTRAQRAWREGLGVVLVLATALLAFWRYGAIRLAPRPWSLLIATALTGAVVGGVALARSVGRARAKLGELIGIVVLTPILLLSLKVGISSSVAGMVRAWPERPGFRCLSLSCICLLTPLAAFFVLRRGTALTHVTWRGAAAGTAIGAAVWVLVDMNCPVSYVPHLLLGHVLPLTLSAAIGASLARPLLALRSR